MLVVLALLAAAAPQRLWTDAPATNPRPTAPPASISQLVKSSMPAVVGIVATTARGSDLNDPFHDFLEKMYGSGDGPREAPVRGIGTGFFIRADGLIATNGHVVEGATDITVQVGEEERTYRGRVVGKDDATDLALLKIEGAQPFPVLALGDSDHLEVGEWVIAIGNPFGLSRSVSAGIVSYKGRRDVNPSGRPGFYDFIQTDAAINPGNSGGPLLDARGAVIGINAAVNPAGQGIGFAIPIIQLKEVSPQLAGRGHVVRGWMGASIQESISPELAESFAVPGGKGVVLTEILEGGPAALAGLRAGDVITSYDGEPLAEAYRLRWLAAATPPGKSVRLGVWRLGRLSQKTLILGKNPREPAFQPEPPPPALRKEQEPFGFAVDETNKDSLEPGEGVRISSIDLRGPAYRAGLREGDLITEFEGQAVPDRAAWKKALGSLGPSGVARVFVRRGGRAVFFGLRRDSLTQPVRAAAAQ
jgi:serine protease Do